MRHLLLLPFLFILPLSSLAQTAPKKPAAPKKQLATKKQLPRVYTYVEKPASFPVVAKTDAYANPATEALYTFLADNFRDKEALASLTTYNSALYTLVINPAGKLAEVKVQKGISATIDQEFVRVLKSVPAWVPAEHNGVKVHSLLNVPVNVYPPSYDARFKQIQEYKYYVAAEQMASYKGGVEELRKALQARFKSLPKPLVKDPSKPLLLSFCINTDGTVLKGNTRVFNGYNAKTNELLAGVVEKLPAFKPAIQDEREVIMNVAVPIGLDEKGNVAWIYAPPKK